MRSSVCLLIKNKMLNSHPRVHRLLKLWLSFRINSNPLLISAQKQMLLVEEVRTLHRWDFRKKYILKQYILTNVFSSWSKRRQILNIEYWKISNIFSQNIFSRWRKRRKRWKWEKTHLIGSRWDDVDDYHAVDNNHQDRDHHGLFYKDHAGNNIIIIMLWSSWSCL